MKLDYKEIGRRIAHRRKQLGLKQATVEEMADIGEKYLSCIERATSTPSTEVLMRLAIALDTTPDEFLVGTVRQQDEAWRDVAELLRPLSPDQLSLAQRQRPAPPGAFQGAPFFLQGLGQACRTG